MLEIKNYTPQHKGVLKGFFDVFIPKTGWTIKRCALFENNGRKWVNLPSHQYTDQSGEKKYTSTIEMPKNHKEEFNRQCLEALKEFKNVVKDHDME